MPYCRKRPSQARQKKNKDETDGPENKFPKRLLLFFLRECRDGLLHLLHRRLVFFRNKLAKDDRDVIVATQIQCTLNQCLRTGIDFIRSLLHNSFDLLIPKHRIKPVRTKQKYLSFLQGETDKIGICRFLRISETTGDNVTIRMVKGILRKKATAVDQFLYIRMVFCHLCKPRDGIKQIPPAVTTPNDVGIAVEQPIGDKSCTH